MTTRLRVWPETVLPETDVILREPTRQSLFVQ